MGLFRPKAYKFHSVFGPSANSAEIYRDVLTAPVDSLMDDGYNVAIFAYGQTGSGKTFTMAGGGAFTRTVSTRVE